MHSALPPAILATRRFLTGALLAVTLIILVFGAWLYREERARSWEHYRQTLQAVAELKVTQVTDWRAERHRDIKRDVHSPLTRAPLVLLGSQAAPEAIQAAATAQLERLRRGDLYDDAYLVTPAYTVINRQGVPEAPLGQPTRRLLESLGPTDRILSTEPFFDSAGYPVLEFAGGMIEADGRFLGWAVLRSRLDQEFYTQIATMPMANATAESFLVQLHGDAGTYFTPRRLDPEGRQDRMLTALEAMAAIVAQARQRPLLAEGKDYRGVQVLRDLRLIPGTSWLLVTKMDVAEIIGEVRTRAIREGVLVVSLLGLLTVGLGTYHWRREGEYFRGLAEAQASEATAREAFEDSLRERNEEFRLLFDRMLEGFALHEMVYDEAGQAVDYRFLKVNPAFERMTGLQAAEIVGRTVKQVMPETEEGWIRRYAQVVSSGESLTFEKHTGELGRFFRVRAFRPQPGRFATVFEDVTDVTLAKLHATRLNQFYQSLSRCTQDIVRAERIEEVFVSVCEHVVAIDGIKMAWVGLINERTNLLEPAAAYGEGTNYLDGLTISVDANSPWGQGPAGNCVRTGQADWCQDFATDPRMAPWREEGLKHGWAAAAAIPLLQRGRAIGCLLVYAGKAHIFDDEVQQLFVDMAHDLGFAISNLEDKRERELAEQARRAALAESEVLRTALDQVSAYVYMKDAQGCYTYANRPCRELFGVTAESLLGLDDFAFFPAAAARQIQVYDARVWRGENTKEELIVDLPDGGRRVYIEAKTPIRDAQDPAQVRGLLGISTDITGIKEAEEKERLHNRVLEVTSNAITITDRKGVIVWVNPAFTTYTGYTAAEVIGRKPSLLRSGKQTDEFYAHLWSTIEAGNVWQGEIVNRRKDGSTYHEEMTITPMRSPQGEITHYIAIKQDISDRKVLEEVMLRDQRLESIGTLASGVAHDLNNILAPILLAADLLRQDNDAETKQALLDGIETAVKRGSGIIKQVLTFARGTAGDRLPLHLEHLLGELHKIVAETFPKSIDVQLALSPELWLISGDVTQIHQVLLNLCINARDAMPSGGQLRLAARNLELTAPLNDSRSAPPPGRYVVVTVQDSGAGIAPANLDKIFDPFFSTKELGEGTGLGLSTAVGIVRSHGGFIEVDSTLGAGSSFRVYLPAVTAAPTVPLAAASPLPRHGEGYTILVVDDEAGILASASLLLRSKGYRVLTAVDGQAALDVWTAESNPIDVLVTDVMMPKMNGFALIEQVRRRYPRTRLVAATGQSTPEIEARLRALGVVAILHKPYGREPLLLAVEKALHQGEV